jgi:hypothetical protein
MSILGNTTVNGVVTQTSPATLPTHLIRLQEAQALLASLFRGAWNNATAYVAGQLVEYNNILWQALAANTNQTPGSGGSWSQILSGGTAGSSAYVYVGYASDTNGTGFSLTPTNGLNYVAFLASTSPISSPAASNFAGLWRQYIGAAGAAGAAGASAYVYVGYASDTNGTGFSLTPASGLNYVAFLTSSTSIATPTASNFAGLWVEFVGATGATGAGMAGGGTDGVTVDAGGTLAWILPRTARAKFRDSPAIA